MDVFISYSRKDRAVKDAAGVDVISRIQQAFQDAGISYWLDEEGIHSGETFASVISRNIAESKVFLFVSSANSNASRWTCGEIATANSYDKRIIPFKIDGTPYDPSVTIYLAALDTIDYTANPDKAVRRLVKSVQQYLEEMEAEARRVEEEKQMLAEKKRLEAERERIRIENAKVIAGLTIRQTELEGKIHAIDTRIDSFLNEKNQLLTRLTTLRSRSAELSDEKKIEAQLKALSLSKTIAETTEKEKQQRRRIPIWLFVALALVLAIGLVLGLFFRNRAPKPSLDVVAIQPPADTIQTPMLDTAMTVSVDHDTLKVDILPVEEVKEPPVIENKQSDIKQEPQVVEKPKVVAAIEGNEGDFSFRTPSDEAGGKTFSVTPSSRLSIETPDWCRAIVDNPKRKQSGFELQWEENKGEARTGDIKVKAGESVIVISISQMESKAITSARLLKEKMEKARADSLAAMEEAKKKEKEAQRKKPILIYGVEGVRIVAQWDADSHGNEFFITPDWITVAQWKAVMKPTKTILEKEYNEYKRFDTQEEVDAFIKKLSVVSNKHCEKPSPEQLNGNYQSGYIKVVVVEY